MEICSRFTGMERKDGAFLLHTDNADIKVCFVTDEIVRVRASFDHELAEESYILMTTAWKDRMDDLFQGERTRVEPFAAEVTEDEKQVTFATGKVTLVVDKDPINFRLLSADGTELYSTLPGNPFVKDSNNRVVAYSRMKEDDCFYGFGEKSGLLDKNKTFQRERATDAMGYDAEKMDTLYKHIPFYIRLDRETRKAVGVFYHNFYESVFNMGCEKSNYWPRYTYFQADGGDIDLFLLAGPTIPDILNEYTLLTGRSALPTKQSLGYCASTMYYAELEKNCDAQCDFEGKKGTMAELKILHSNLMAYTVTQPWMYEENLPYVREAYNLRYRLLPYLYSLMYESNQDGMPAWRPLFLEFPQDPKCYTDKSLTFMFGKSILVANVVEKGATTRSIYLPAGCKWYDINDNLREYEGGQTIEVPVTLASIPMFLRGSAIVVTTEDVKHILKDTMRQVDLLVSAESDTSFVLYDDDGHTEDYKKGVYAKTIITVKAGDRTDIRFATEGSYESPVERMTLKLVSKKKGAFWVSVDGQQLTRYIVRDGWEDAESGWYYNLSDRTIWAKFNKPAKKDFTVTVSTEKFDLIGMAED